MADEDFIWAVKSEGHLITRKAGGSAREQANHLRAAAPVRTRLARAMKVHTNERSYRIGADGEETVGSRLAKLDSSNWLVLHDILLNESGTNLDHLVIGPAGVFSLNTKHRPKATVVVTERGFRVNGHRENYLPVAVAEATKVSRVLSKSLTSTVDVRPVIVVMGAQLDVRTPPRDVDVIRRRDLPKWFLRLPEVLRPPQAREIMSVAGRPSTWRPPNVTTETSLTVKRWTRYGKKRLYVNDVAGHTLGYRDEVTGEIHVSDDKDLSRVEEALKRR